MKVSNAVSERVQQVQQWIGSHGGSIRNAYMVNGQALAELEAKQGVIEKVLWRLTKENPAMPLDTESMMKALAPKALVKEVRKQMKVDQAKQVTHDKGFAAARRNLVLSVIPEDAPDREQQAAAVEDWLKRELPRMTNSKEILAASKLRLEAGVDFPATFPPLNTKQEHLDAFGKANPGRVYVQNGKSFLVLKPGEKAELGPKGLSMATLAAPAPEIS